ncbi:hypothetical protein GYMLUDRAFT_263881 [Collybiopsis luxurians FD-317 M1]|uniref:Uncharacterized protein n=1 Tax=Collybiopsis luxurians FD-317 M1 TaxID=944289 RepID=A0A0D0AYZ8_9AGAR|nr:hypothetical protein GYMLUDRAFT_263881 [Collybiopsis luxurians FD-317 M1]
MLIAATSSTHYLTQARILSLQHDLIRIGCEFLFFGIHATLFITSTYLLFYKGIRLVRARIFLLLVTTVMFLASIGVIILDMMICLQQVQSYGLDSPTSLELSTQLILASNILMRVNFLLGDVIVVWRTWVVWPHSIFVRLVLAVCMLGTIGAVFGNGVKSTIDFLGNSFVSNTYSLVMSLPPLVTNLTATLLIALRVWEYRRNIKSSMRSATSTTRIEKTLILLVESGLIYCAIWLLILIAGFDVMSAASNALILGLAVSLTGIYPTFIVIMVSLDKSHANTIFSGDSGTMPISQPLHFNPEHTEDTEHIESRVESEFRDNLSPVFEKRGPAGCVVANRLSENPDFNFLLLEAGGSAGRISQDLEWNTSTIPQPSMNNRSLTFPHAVVLGGNNMVYSRGTKDDWDRFAQVTGDEGWPWDSIQPFIVKNERWTPPADNRNTTGEFDPAVHSTTGINAVSLAGFLLPMNSVALKASQELGGIFLFNLDPNAGSSLSFSWSQFTIDGSLRSSAATSYLGPEFLKRANLHVLINARVSRALNSGAEPTAFRGVEFVPDLNGPKFRVNASKEVILSTGFINTPQVLMNSGIGDSGFLSSLGIDSLVHLPSVGQNLSVQPILRNIWNVNPDARTFDIIFQNETALDQVLQEWTKKKQGPLVDSGGSQGISFRLNGSILDAIGEDRSSGKNGPHPSLGLAPGVLVAGSMSNTPSMGKFLSVPRTVSCPTSRGSITINSTNLFASPVIDPKLISTDFDTRTMREAVKMAFVFLSVPAWTDFVTEPSTALAQAVESDHALDEYIRNNASPTAHVIRTASMTSPEAGYGVVNPDLSVKGLTGLRVADSSVLPFLPSGPNQAPVYILAERASGLMKEKWGSYN